jgi:hypothetical protein
MNATRRARIEFFAAHAGYGTPPGRMMCAKSLADAEEWALANGVEAEWEFDPYVDTSWADAETLAKLDDGTYEYLQCGVSFGERTAGLGGIVVDINDKTYPRVVEAELFSELMTVEAYRVTIVATVEAGSAEEAQRIAGNLLAGRSESGRIPLTGAGSWAPETKKVERIS